MDNKYLWKRKNRYWVRVRVPDKVRDIIGSVELCLNLYTSDLQEANVLKHGAVSKLKKRIESARKIKDNQGPETTKEELLKQYAQAIRDEYETGNYDTSNGPDAIDLLEPKLYELYGKEKTNQILHSHDPQWSGEILDEATHDSVLEAVRIADLTKNPLSVVSKRFLEEESKVLKPATLRRKKRNIYKFIQWIGDIEIDQVKKSVAGEYITRVIDKENPAYDTIRNVVADLSSLFTWAESRLDIERHPFLRHKIPQLKRGKQKRKPWSNDNIQEFINHEKVGPKETLATSIALYTGMRLEEICQLKQKDVFDDCFHIYNGKTKSASRVIPVHTILQSYLSNLGNEPEEYIIKGLVPGGYDKKRSWNFQKKLGRLRKKIDLPEGCVFHTLRNNFATNLENNGVPRNHISQLMGHEDNNLALDVYSGGLAIEILRDSMTKLTYGSEVDSLIGLKLDELP